MKHTSHAIKKKKQTQNTVDEWITSDAPSQGGGQLFPIKGQIVNIPCFTQICLLHSLFFLLLLLGVLLFLQSFKHEGKKYSYLVQGL